MAKTINVPGVGEAQVPDSATDAEIVSFVKKVQAAGSVKAAYDQAVAERPGAFMSGVYGAGADLSAALARATQEAGLTPAVDFTGISESLGQKSAQYTPTIGSIENVGGIGDLLTYGGEMLAQSAPRMLATGAAGYFGGPRAAFGVGAPLFTGSNLRRQMEEQGVPLSETNLKSAVAAAIPQAGVELIPLQAANVFKTLKTAADPVRRSLAREIVSRAGKVSGTEALTETGQQALEILQANPDKLLEMDDQTVSELINAAVGGALLGGVLGGGMEALQVRGERKAEQQAAELQNLKDSIQREADEGRSLDIRSEANLGIETLKSRQATPNLEVKKIRQVIPRKDGTTEERDVYAIRDLGDKTKGKVNIGPFASEEAAKSAIDGYKSLIAKPSQVSPQATPQTPSTKIETKITGEEKKAAQPPLPAEAPSVAPGLGKAASELSKVPDSPVPEAPATFEAQREALQKGTRAAMLYNTTDPVPRKPISPEIKRIKLDDGRTIDFNRGKFTEAQVREAVANNRLNEILELGPFNREEAVASELRGNAPVAVVERTPAGVEVKAAAGTTETAPIQLQALEQTKTAPENIVAVESVQELVTKRVAGRAAAPEPIIGVAPETTPAPVLLASRPEVATKFAEVAKKRMAALGLKNVGLRIETAVKTDTFGRYASGAYDPATKAIEISLSSVDPAASEAEFLARLEETFNHEAIHAVVDLGVITKAEFATLLQAASTTKYPGSNFTYLDRAFATYAPMMTKDDGTIDRVAVSEEAIAEMFRDWNAGRLQVQEKPRGLFNRIREFFRRLRGAAKEAGFDKIFEEIESGEVAARTPVNEVYDGKANNGLTDGVDLGVKKFSIKPRYEPQKTVKAYKLFRISKEQPGLLFPLFVDANTPVKIGEWVEASMGEGYAFKGANGNWYIPSTPYMILNENTGKYVKRTTGDSIPIPNDKVRQELIANGYLSKDSKATTITALARRPGWHAGDSPFSTHLGTKEGGTKSESGAGVIDTRPPYQVWAEVELPADVDWQSKAINAAERRKSDDKNTGAKKGDVILKTAHITDRIPEGGFYTYKTSPTMTGAWMIGGAMKVNRVLSDAEVASINKDLGREDLPRRMPRYDEGVEYKPAKEARQPKADSKKYSIAPQLATSTQDRQNTAFSLFPYLRSMPSRFFPDRSRIIRAGTNPETAAEDLASLDAVLSRHGNTLATEQSFADYMADILGKAANPQTGVPLVPYNAVRIANDPSIIEEQLRSLTPGQLAQARDGLNEAKRLRRAYQNGSATIEHTGKLLLWGILSRGVSPFVQESLFLDAVRGHGNIGGVGRFIEAAAKGEFNLEEYNEWLSLVIPEGSTGAGAKHNLGAFGKTTLTKLQQRLPNGQTVFERLHDIIADYSLSGKEARREFHKINSGIGINNKVISFMLLVSGRNDVLVLDRVQMRNQFDDGRFEGYNLYDGEKIRSVNEDGTEGKAQTVTGTAIAGLGDGIMGLAYYEALERDLEASIRAAYAAVGRGSEASLGRYHWESWVASSAQEVDHGTVTGIINDALGQIDPYGLVTTGEGKYDTFMSGAKYGYTKDGQPYVALPDGLGNNYVFTPKDAKEVVKGYKKKRFGIIEDPDTFRVSESRTGAWYERPEINREALRDYLAGQIERKRNYVEPLLKAGEEQPNVYRPRLGRAGTGKVTPGKTPSEIADKYIKKFSLPPAYNNIKVMSKADIDKVVGSLSYGAVVDKLQSFFNLLGKVVPKRFLPEREQTSDFMRKFVDRMLPVGELIDYIRKNGGTVADAMDTYMKEDIVKGEVANMLRQREDNLYSDPIKFIRSNGLLLKATKEQAARGQFGVEDYLIAKHATERNRVIRERGNPDPEKGSGMTDERAAEIIAAVERSPKAAQFKQAADLVYKIIKDTNKIRIEAGLNPDFSNMDVVDEDGNTVKADLTEYEFYVPLRGFADEDPDYGESKFASARVGRGFNIGGREDKQALGRKSEAGDIIAHAVLQNTEAIIRAGKNRVGNSLIMLVQANPDRAKEFGIKILKKAPTKQILNKDGVIQTIVDPNYKMRDDILVVKAMPGIAGYKPSEQVIFEIENEGLAKALNGQVNGAESLNKVLAFSQGLNRWIALVNTGVNPEFMIMNFARDLEAALINAGQYDVPGFQKKVGKDVLKALRGAYAVIKDPNAKGYWQDAFRDFQENGGMTAGMVGVRGIEKRIEAIGQLLKEPTGSYRERAYNGAKSVVDFILDLNTAVENGIRLSTYQNLVEAGFTKERAAQAARNLTVNFDRKGEYGPLLNALYLFFNASIQGTLAIGIAAARSKKVQRMLGGVIILGMMQDLINAMLSPEDDDGISLYDKIPEYKLRTNIILMDPFGITDRGYLSIPMPYGYNAFHNFGRSLARKTRGSYSTLDATNSIVGTFMDAFNPIGGTENLLNAIAPTAVDPLAALYMNQDFTGKKIYPGDFPGATPKANSHTYWSTTNPIFKSTAQFLNSATGGGEYVQGSIDIKPDIIEYLYNYFTGGAGAFVTRTYDTAVNTIPTLLRGDLEEVELNNVPVLRRVFGNVSEKVMTEGYMDNANYLLSRGKELEAAIKSGDSERIKEVREKYKDEIRIYPRVKALVNRRNKIASDLRKLEENPRIPEEQKKPRIDQMKKQITQIRAEVNKIYEQVAGDKFPSIF